MFPAKRDKIQSSCQYLIALLGSARVKAARKILMKLTPGCFLLVFPQSPAKHVAIVAHSYGGIVTTSLAKKFLPEFEKRVFSIMFTDSVHSLKKDRSDAVANFLEKIALNYVATHGGEPLGTEIPNKYKDAVPMVSAGKHLRQVRFVRNAWLPTYIAFR